MRVASQALWWPPGGSTSMLLEVAHLLVSLLNFSLGVVPRLINLVNGGVELLADFLQD